MKSKSRKVTSVQGFQFSGLCCGIKKRPIKDLALIYSEVPATTVGTFTTHKGAAAPVLLSRRQIRSGLAQAVVMNSGNANAFTGERGMRDAKAMVAKTARSLGVPKSRVLVCSTGLIGEALPIQKVLRGIEKGAGALKVSGAKQAAEAILTTDQGIKLATRSVRIGRREGTLLAFAKGAGMIEPQMRLEPAGKKHATMLAFVMTDLALERRFAGSCLKEAVEQTFNRITVDGDVSTNDTCLLMANGLAANDTLRSSSRGARVFSRSLTELLEELAHAMVADGEGAIKVVRIEVRGAKNQSEARRIAYAVANSQLVRTSFFGSDPHWGRVLAAVCSSGATCDPRRVDIAYGGVTVCRNGLATGQLAAQRAKKVVQGPEWTLRITCHAGIASHHILSSDLGLNYVKLNSNYRS